MSDDILRMLRANDARLALTEVKEVSPLYLPWSQRILNPFPLASSGNVVSDMAQPWAVNLLAFYCTVYVITTNNGANFWTIRLQDAAATTLASFTTAAIANDTLTRFAVTTGIVQPSGSNAQLRLVPTATGAPGAILLFPSVALLRTGN